MHVPESSRPSSDRSASRAGVTSRRLVTLLAAGSLIAVAVVATVVWRSSADTPPSAEAPQPSPNAPQSPRPSAKAPPSSKASPSAVTPQSSASTSPTATNRAASPVVPVELRFTDDTMRITPATVMKVVGAEAFLTIVRGGEAWRLREAFALADNGDGLRRVPLTLYAATENYGSTAYGIFAAGPKSELPAPFDPSAVVKVKEGEQLKFRGFDVVRLGEQDSFKRWTDDVVRGTSKKPQRLSPPVYYRLPSGRSGFGIVETVRGEPVAIITPWKSTVPLASGEVVHRPYGNEELAVPTFPHVLRVHITKTRQAAKAKIVVQLFDPEKKLADLRLLGRVNNQAEFVIAGDKWTNKPADGLELKLSEGNPDRAGSRSLDPAHWPHLRLWSGELEVGTAPSRVVEYQLVNVNVSGELSRVGPSRAEHVLEVSEAK